MQQSIELEIVDLTPGKLADYLAFFDGDAFSDNPRWAGCYCHFNHAPHEQKQWRERTGAENRAAVSALISGGQMHGYLAYAGGRVVGWCNAGPRALYTTLDDGMPGDPATTGAIICFVVAPAQRGTGVARRLLDAACNGLRAQGMKVVEGYPQKEAGDAAASHRGPLAMFLGAGFTVAEERDGNVLVRKEL